MISAEKPFSSLFQRFSKSKKGSNSIHSSCYARDAVMFSDRKGLHKSRSVSAVFSLLVKLEGRARPWVCYGKLLCNECTRTDVSIALARLWHVCSSRRCQEPVLDIRSFF